MEAALDIHRTQIVILLSQFAVAMKAQEQRRFRSSGCQRAPSAPPQPGRPPRPPTPAKRAGLDANP
jgi:hypothetical protein